MRILIVVMLALGMLTVGCRTTRKTDVDRGDTARVDTAGMRGMMGMDSADHARMMGDTGRTVTGTTGATGDTTTTPSGLRYVDRKVGEGSMPQVGQKAIVHYTGWLTDGRKFDSSKDRNRPFDFALGQGQVIKGWDEGVATMKIGGVRRLIVPPQLAYGERGAGGGQIPPNSTLVFEVELLAVE